jgi:hypothetical protein
MKRFLGSALALMLCTALAFTTTGCTSQQTAADMITTVGTAVASLEAIEGNTSAVQQIQTDFSAASSAVANWKTGTATQQVAEALTLVENDLNLLPVSSQDQALIDLAIGTVDQLLVEFPGTTSTTTPTATTVSFHYAFYQAKVQHRTVHLAKVPKSKKDFKAQWNAALRANPKLKAATVK